MNKNLRLIAATIVFESKLSKVSKLQLLNFIKEEASDTQIKALLMDAEIVELDKQAEEIINSRFENHRFGKYLKEANLNIISSAKVTTAVAGKIAIEEGKDMLVKAQKICMKYNGKQKQICMDKLKNQVIKTQIKVLESNKRKCFKIKDSKECISLINKKIEGLKGKLNTLVMT